MGFSVVVFTLLIILNGASAHIVRGRESSFRNHRKYSPCLAHEIERKNCRNGGICYALRSTLTSPENGLLDGGAFWRPQYEHVKMVCHCLPGFSGKICDEILPGARLFSPPFLGEPAAAVMPPPRPPRFLRATWVTPPLHECSLMERMMCKNGADCYIHYGLADYSSESIILGRQAKCACAQGFKGSDCGQKEPDDWMCSRDQVAELLCQNGYCTREPAIDAPGKIYYCRCSRGYTGDRCQFSDRPRAPLYRGHIRGRNSNDALKSNPIVRCEPGSKCIAKFYDYSALIGPSHSYPPQKNATQLAVVNVTTPTLPTLAMMSTTKRSFSTTTSKMALISVLSTVTDKEDLVFLKNRERQKGRTFDSEFDF